MDNAIAIDESRPMRVAVVTQYFPTSAQPWAGHSAYQTLRLLAEKVDLHVFYPEARYPSFLTPASAQRPSLEPGWNPPGVSATYIPYPVLPVVSRPLNGFVMAHQLLPAVRDFAPDILLNYVVYPDGLAAIRIARALHVPVVVTAIGSDLNRMSDPLCAMLTRGALREADFITTVSQDLCKTARLLGAEPKRSRAKLNGCDTAVFYPRPRREAREELGLEETAEIIVYVGRLDVRKGLLELVEAMDALCRKREDVRCYIVGDGPDRPKIAAAIAARQLEEVVVLVPSCPTEQVALWMAAADLCTLPSYREGCPNVVLEALASGRPIVATRVGGIPELVDDTCGRLIPAADAYALERALEEVLTTPWDASIISNRHSRSWMDVAVDLEQVLEQVLFRARYLENKAKAQGPPKPPG